MVLKKGLGMETSHPDTPKADPLKGQPEVKVLPPDLAWRLEAACSDADVNQFMVLDAEELGVPPKKVASLNKARLAITREKFCNHCTVVAECEHSAQVEGSIAFSLRGGISPYDRRGVPVGRTRPDGISKINKVLAGDREYESMLRGEPQNPASRDAVRARNKARAQSPADAHWRAHKPGWATENHSVEPGSGWALSQDLTRTVLMVLYHTNAGLRTRFVEAKHVDYDVDATPRVLMNFPDKIEVPKEVPGFWQNHSTPKGVPSLDTNPWWKEHGMYL